MKLVIKFNPINTNFYFILLHVFFRSLTCEASTVQQQSQPLHKETPRTRLISKSVDSPNYNISPESPTPPSPPVRQISSSIPPDIKPRHSSRSYVTSTSPVKQQQQQQHSPVPANKALPNSSIRSASGSTSISSCSITDYTAKPYNNIEVPERRKRSIDVVEEPTNIIASPPVEYAEVRKHSVDLQSSFVSTQTQPISSSPSPAVSASSGPSSPNHTEDEKQENESNEKTDLFDEIITECKY